MQMLGSLLKPKSRLSYARVDEVVFEPNGDQPERIQISGVFVMEEPSGAGYAVPRRGYLYLTLPSEGRDLPVIRNEWNEWKKVAGTRQVVRFYTTLYQGDQVRVRAPDEEPSVPDATPTRLVMPVRSDTEYAPVKVLLEFD